MSGLRVILIGGLIIACGEGPSADLVFRGGRVYTGDDSRPVPEAVAVRGDRIVFVGSALDVQSWIAAETRVVEIGEGMLSPGFHDTHVHPVSNGVELAQCDLNVATSRADVIRLVRTCDREQAGPWLLGGGFQLPFFPRGAPSKELLDSLSPDRPAYLSSADGHSAWVNSHALALAGVDRTTPDPPEGVIVRTRGGDPQGTLRESAMNLVARHMPPPSDEEYLVGLERALAMAARFGITTLHEASGTEAYLRAYRAAEERGSLSARVIVSMHVDPAAGLGEVERIGALKERYESHLVMPSAAKLFVDGVIESQTAALLAPYTDRPGYIGEMNLSPTMLARLIGGLDSAGFKVHVHAIGDRAIRETFDAFAEQHGRDGGSGPRHIMAHIQLFDPSDIPRFAELGVVASFQPLWAYPDTYMTDLTEPRVGPERARWLYPIRSVVETGAIVAAGSDWGVTSMNPMLAIEVALTRRDPSVDEGPSWWPEERVSLETMLRAYTWHGALAGDLEDRTGTIAVGKSADLVLWERDLFALAPHQISDVAARMTVLEGRIVYEAIP